MMANDYHGLRNDRLMRLWHLEYDTACVADLIWPMLCAMADTNDFDAAAALAQDYINACVKVKKLGGTVWWEVER